MAEEIMLELNTGNGENSFITKKITGFIDSLIIETEKLVEIAIESEKGYELFHSRDLNGIKYIPLRTIAIDKKNHLIKFAGAVPYYLHDEELIVHVRGGKNINALITLRLL